MIDLLDDDAMIDLQSLLAENKYLAGMRPYQSDAFLSVENGWANHKRQLVTMATGCGKTPFMGACARKHFDIGGRTLVLAHTDELIDQAIDKFIRITGLPATKEKAKDRALLSDRVVVGSVQTLCRTSRLDGWPVNHFDMILTDECHRSLADMYQRVYERFPDSRHIGVTATADRGDKKALGEFYENLAFDYPLAKAVDDGWLVRPIVQTLPVEIDITKVKIAATGEGSDINPKHVSSMLEPLLGSIAKAIREAAGDRKILIFMPGVESSQKMALAMREVGYVSDWVAGADKERSEKIEAYKRGEIQCLSNAVLLTEGFDCDDVEVVVVLRATQIRSLYVQMVGRGTRPLSSIVPLLQKAKDKHERKQIIASSAKPHVLLLDPLWLHEKHDLTTPASLVAKNKEVERQMRGKQGDLLQIQEQTERDFLETLRKEIEKNRNRRSQTIDPLTFAVAIDSHEIANYTPKTLWELRDPTAEQLRALEKQGIETELVRWRGQAELIIKAITQRQDRGLCSVRMMQWLKKHHIDATLMPHDEAVKKQRALMKGFRR